MTFRSILMKDLTTQRRHHFLLSAVGPRPIALVTSQDREGNINLSPFSFFNLFSTNPPVAIFSPALRGRDGSMKDTHSNVLEHKEVCISLVNHEIVHQMNLSSNEYLRGVNEYIKAGFTMASSSEIDVPFVMEAPVSFECTVRDVVSLGGEGASGNLVICDIVCMHVQERYLDSEGRLDCQKLDLVGRMGGNWYSRANLTAMFEVTKPSRDLAIGVDSLPLHVRRSKVLSANEKAMLGCQISAPDPEDIFLLKNDKEIIEILSHSAGEQDTYDQLHEKIRSFLDEGRVRDALNLAFIFEN